MESLSFKATNAPFAPGIAKMRVEIPEHWAPSPDKFFKLNFDGASKWNLGKTLGAIRDHNSEIIQMFYGSLGLDSNNAVELEGLVEGLGIADKRSL